jgi:RimJ/RimL family protein N-acetyltransferase
MPLTSASPGFLPEARLRPVRAQDAPDILAAFTASTDMDRQGGVRDEESSREYCEWLRLPGRHANAIAVGPQSRMIGLVAVSVDVDNRNGWFFYWLHPAHRGRGLAARAAATVADRALRPAAEDGWGLDRLELGHRADNPASGAVARAAGFLHEGTERGKFLIGGERVDVLAYGRLSTDPLPATPHLNWEGCAH